MLEFEWVAKDAGAVEPVVDGAGYLGSGGVNFVVGSVWMRAVNRRWSEHGRVNFWGGGLKGGRG